MLHRDMVLAASSNAAEVGIVGKHLDNKVIFPVDVSFIKESIFSWYWNRLRWKKCKFKKNIRPDVWSAYCFDTCLSQLLNCDSKTENF